MREIEQDYKKIFAVQLGPRGRFIISTKVRELLNLNEGDKFILAITSKNLLEIIPLRKQVGATRGIFKDLAPGVSLVDELIQGRRREALEE